MSKLSQRINKIKITLFGNVWNVRILNFIRYLGGGIIAWKIWKSDVFFAGQSPISFLKSFWNWSDNSASNLLGIFLSLSVLVTSLIIYFYLSGKLVKWLINVELSPQQQVQILQKKIYHFDEKTSYSVKNIEKLEKTSFRNSPYTTLQGILILEDQNKRKKKINFICYSDDNILNTYLSPDNLEKYFPTIHFREKSLITWQKTMFVIFLTLSGFFFYRGYHKAQSYGQESMTMREALASETASRIQAQREAEERAKREEAEKEERIKVGRITESKNIDIEQGDIGGNTEQMKEITSNAKNIRDRNENPQSPFAPQHIIMYGPPGTGKTMLAKLMAKKAGVAFVNLNGAMFKGNDSEKRIRECLDAAIQEANGKYMVVLLDEVDKMNPEREAVSIRESWEEGANRGVGYQLLSILSGVDSDRYGKLIFVLTTNELGSLNAALLRSGRVGRKLRVGYPNKLELLKIINIILGRFYDKYCIDYPQLYGNLSKLQFKQKFAKFLLEELSKDNYAVDVGRIFARDKRRDKMVLALGERVVLFTGADVEKIIFVDAPGIMNGKGRQTLTEQDFVEAIKKVFRDNRAGQIWGHRDISRYLMEASAREDDLENIYPDQYELPTSKNPRS